MGTQPKQRCKSRCVPGTLGWFHGHKDNSGLISKEEFATMCFLPCLFSDVGIWPAMTRRCRSYVHCLGMQDASLESRRSAPGSTTRTLWLRCGIWESRCVCVRAFETFNGHGLPGSSRALGGQSAFLCLSGRILGQTNLCKDKQFDMYVQLLFDPPHKDPSQGQASVVRRASRRVASDLPGGEAMSMGLEELVEALCSRPRINGAITLNLILLFPGRLRPGAAVNLLDWSSRSPKIWRDISALVKFAADEFEVQNGRASEPRRSPGRSWAARSSQIHRNAMCFRLQPQPVKERVKKLYRLFRQRSRGGCL